MLFRALVVLGLLLALTGRAHALPEETWLIAIGNNRGDADEVQLLYAERDVRELADVLRTQGKIASDRVRILIDEDAETVRRALVSVNTALRAHAGEGRAATSLLVFYSGHADADALHLRGSRLAFEELRGLVKSSPATMRLLIVDACRSGTVTRVKGVKAAPEFAIQLEDRVEAEGTAILSSSTAGESSQESDRLRASFFSHHLVNALRGAADRNGDARVTLSEAYAYTYAQTLRSSGQTLTLQHPTYAYDVKGSGDLVLTSVGDAGGSTGRLRLGDAGMYLVAEERESGAVVAEVVTPRNRAVLSLPRGRYFVQRRGSYEYREYQLTLNAGEEIDLSRLPYRAVRYDHLVRKRGGVLRSVHGVQLLAGGRGELLPGEGPSPHLVLGYGADLPWLTVGARLRGSTVGLQAVDGALPSRRYELGLSVLLSRYVDLPWFSVAFGISIEGILQAQRFDPGVRQASSRTGLGLGFTGLFAIERALFSGLGLRLEGGPAALLNRRGTTENGAESGSTTDSVFTFWLAGGLTWRL
ncbi:MAG: caspase family protein [Polyangia bacterium]